MPPTTPELEDAVQDWWRQGDGPPGGIATKWMLVCEGMEADGDRWLRFAWSEGLKTWEQKGMLHEALDSQVAVQVADEVRAED